MGVPGYALRLNILTVAALVVLGLLPLVLGFAVFGLELALVSLAVIVVAGVVRTPGNVEIEGTYRLSPRQAPGLFRMVEVLAQRAGLARFPEIRLVPGGQTNAAATLRGSTPVLLVTEALLDRLDSRQLGAVLAHETAHLAHRDLALFRLAQTLQAATLALGLVTLVLAVLNLVVAPGLALFWGTVAATAPAASRLLVAGLSRTREFAADLGAARLTGDPLALADALETIEYRPRTLWDWLWGRRSPLPVDPSDQAFRTHPPTPERVRRLELLSG